MRYLEERGIGLDVGVCKVPIVPGAVIFDLTVGDCRVRPDAAMGYRACKGAAARSPRATSEPGMGASVGKAAGLTRMMKGGLGTASMASGSLVVGAIVAVNCFGDVMDPVTHEILAGTLTPDRAAFAGTLSLLTSGTENADPFQGNTTIGCIATNARLTKAQARRVAIMAHDGFARAIDPIHTMYDGDSIFTLSTGALDADVTVVGSLAAQVMALAIANGVRAAQSAYGLPCSADMAVKLKGLRA